MVFWLAARVFTFKQKLKSQAEEEVHGNRVQKSRANNNDLVPIMCAFFMDAK